MHIEGSARSLVAHDHACVVYRSDDERAAAAGAFARSALAEGSRLLHICENRSPDEVIAELERGAPGMRSAVETGQVLVRAASEVYSTDAGTLDPGDMLERLCTQVQTAEADGWNGLRLIDDMTWILDLPMGLDALLEVEERVDEVFCKLSASALCMYDGRQFRRRACDEIARIHHLVLAEPNGHASPGWELSRIERTPDGAIALAGEVDVSNAQSIVVSLRAEAARTRELRVDLGELSFIDVGGLRALCEVGEELERDGGRMTISSAPRLARTAMRMLAAPCAEWLSWETQ